MFGNIFNTKKDGEQPGQPGGQDMSQQMAPGQQPSFASQSQPMDQSAGPQQMSQQPMQPMNQQPEPNGLQPQTTQQPEQPQSFQAQGGMQPEQPGQSMSSAQSGQPVQPNQQISPSSPANPSMRADVSALSHLDPRATQVLTHAQEETKRIHQQNIEPDQLLIGLLYDQDIYKLLSEFQVDGGQLSKEVQAKEKMGTYKGQPTLSKTSQEAFDQAYRDSKLRGSNFISPEDILIALFSPNFSTAAYLQSKGMKKEAVVDKLSKNPSSTYGHKTVLEKYGIDLTEEARAGRLDPVAGREKEVDRIVHVLLRRTKNNPIIIGEPGVGKTAIVEGLAQMIVSAKVPKDLQDKRIFQLDVASLVAGASHRGEFEERMRGVITEVLNSNNKIILFIDEIHALMGTGEGEGMNAANIIKPHLARGHFQLIGATTTMEYRKYFEKDKAFERRFQPVLCDEPSEENAMEMMKVLRGKYEKFHRVTITDDCLKECIKLAKKYIGERYLPDKAVDLLDEAASEVKLQMDAGKRGDNQVKKGDIEKVVSAWTGIPITKLTEDESEKLLKLEDRIHKRMVDQEEAVAAVSEAVRRGRIGLASGQRPIASFIFLGPTGVGKTELAKTLAELLFGRDDAMARLDMSEYMEKHEVAKLIGAPPGYVGYEEGGVLTEAVRKKPYSIVLMDEIEKAHPDVFNILLQLLEDGRLTDNKGNTISFKNTIVICTSNIGSTLIQKQLSTVDAEAKPTAEQVDKQFKDLQRMIKDELTKFLRPEVLNRFDEVVIFKPLRLEHMAGIVRLGIAKTAALLKEQGFNLQITEKAVARLAKDGYDPVYGARPLRRLIQTAIENPIALAIISKKFVTGDTIVIDFNDMTNEFIFLKGGEVVDIKSLTDDQFKVVLQKVANPDTVLDVQEKQNYSQLHDKVVTASTGGNKTASDILSVTAATPKETVQKIRSELEAAKAKGDALATEILDVVGTVATQLQAADNLKTVLLQILKPETIKDTAKKEQFTQLHERIVEEGDKNNPVAKAVLAVTNASTPEAISKLMSDLQHAKDQDDELATEILAAVNSEVAAKVQEAHAADPNTKLRKVLKQISNPLYLAAPEDKARYSQLYDKIDAANKQNHPIAASIMSLTDITSDNDIQQLQSELEKAKASGDPLATEILETFDYAIKHEAISNLIHAALLTINPLSAETPKEREDFTILHDKVSQASQQGNQIATQLLNMSETSADADWTKFKETVQAAAAKNDEIAKLVIDAAGSATSTSTDAQSSQPATDDSQVATQSMTPSMGQSASGTEPMLQQPFASTPQMPSPAPAGAAMPTPAPMQNAFSQQPAPQQVVEPVSPGIQSPMYSQGVVGPAAAPFSGQAVSSAVNLVPEAEDELNRPW